MDVYIVVFGNKKAKLWKVMLTNQVNINNNPDIFPKFGKGRSVEIFSANIFSQIFYHCKEFSEQTRLGNTNLLSHIIFGIVATPFLYRGYWLVLLPKLGHIVWNPISNYIFVFEWLTYLCVSCEFLPLYVLTDHSIFKDHQCNQIFIFYS